MDGQPERLLHAGPPMAGEHQPGCGPHENRPGLELIAPGTRTTGPLDRRQRLEHPVTIRESGDPRFSHRVPAPGLVLDRAHRRQRAVTDHGRAQIDRPECVEGSLDRCRELTSDFDDDGLRESLTG
jgi:hypothetical protein